MIKINKNDVWSFKIEPGNFNFRIENEKSIGIFGYIEKGKKNTVFPNPLHLLRK